MVDKYIETKQIIQTFRHSNQTNTPKFYPGYLQSLMKTLLYWNKNHSELFVEKISMLRQELINAILLKDGHIEFKFGVELLQTLKDK